VAVTPGRPTLLIVNGLPATGKTGLARQLGRELHWPIIHKDAIKELLFDTLGHGTLERSRELGVATIALLYHMAACQLRAGVSAIVESNFKPTAAAQQLNLLLAKHGARALQILCTCAPAERQRRFFARARHPGHADAALSAAERAALLSERLDPIPLAAPLLTLDTTDFAQIDIASVLAWVNRSL
jgi:predicted kinase